VIYSGDLICDSPLGAMIVSHQLSGAMATVLVSERRVSPTTETKPGKAPKVGGLGRHAFVARRCVRLGRTFGPRRWLQAVRLCPCILIRLMATPLPQRTPTNLSPPPNPPHPPPQGVDYLGLDPTRRLLLFSASHPDALRDLKIPLAAVQRHGAVEVRSDLMDHHLYVLSRWGVVVGGVLGVLGGGAVVGLWRWGVENAQRTLQLPAPFLIKQHQSPHGNTKRIRCPPPTTNDNRSALELLASKPNLSSIKLDLIPALCRHQLQPAAANPAPARTASNAAAAAAGASPAAGGGGTDGGAVAAADELPGADYLKLSLNGSRSSGGMAGKVAVYMSPEGRFCGRVNTLQAYGDVNREVSGTFCFGVGWGGGSGGCELCGLSPALGRRVVSSGGHSALFAPFPSSLIRAVNPHPNNMCTTAKVAAPDSALHLTGLTPSRYDNVVAPSATLGNKATVSRSSWVGVGLGLVVRWLRSGLGFGRLGLWS